VPYSSSFSLRDSKPKRGLLVSLSSTLSRTAFNSPSYRAAAWSRVSTSPLPTSLTGTAVAFLARPRLRTRYIRPTLFHASDAPPRRQFDTAIDTFAAASLCLDDGAFFRRTFGLGRRHLHDHSSSLGRCTLVPPAADGSRLRSRLIFKPFNATTDASLAAPLPGTPPAQPSSVTFLGRQLNRSSFSGHPAWAWIFVSKLSFIYPRTLWNAEVTSCFQYQKRT